MYFLVSSPHWPEFAEEGVGLLEALVDAGVVAAPAALLLTATPAAAEDVGLEPERVLAFEGTLELIFVLKVVGTAEELVFGMLEALFEAKEAAVLELAFWLGVESILEATLT